MLCYGQSDMQFLLVYEMSLEPLSGFAPNSHGRRVWCLDRTSLNVKVKGQGHQGQKRHFSALSAACVRFMFGKISLCCRGAQQGGASAAGAWSRGRPSAAGAGGDVRLDPRVEASVDAYRTLNQLLMDYIEHVGPSLALR